MKLKILVGILVFLIVVNLATIGTYLYYHFKGNSTEFSGQFPPLGPRGESPMAQLSQAQRKKLIELMDGFRSATGNLHDRIRTLEDEISELLQQDPVQKENIDTKLKEIADVRLDISKMAVAKLIEAKSFLNARQQEGFYNAILRSRPEFPAPHGFDGPPAGTRFRGKLDSMGGPPPLEGEPPPPPR